MMKIIRTIFVATVLFFTIPHVSLAFSQTISNGNRELVTIPAGVTEVTFSGSGGSGGNANSYGGGGGGGGAYVYSYTPGVGLILYLGGGGGGAWYGTGGTGGTVPGNGVGGGGATIGAGSAGNPGVLNGNGGNGGNADLFGTGGTGGTGGANDNTAGGRVGSNCETGAGGAGYWWSGWGWAPGGAGGTSNGTNSCTGAGWGVVYAGGGGGGGGHKAGGGGGGGYGGGGGGASSGFGFNAFGGGGGGGSSYFNPSFSAVSGGVSIPVSVIGTGDLSIRSGIGGGGGSLNGYSASPGSPGTITISWVDPGSPGTVNVSSNISSSWTITGPATINGSGTSQSSPSQPVGTYAITWGAVDGYTAPASQGLTLTSGSTITFNGTYTVLAPCLATTINNCSLPATPSGSSSGTCSPGYFGSCNYSCNSGTWSQNSNSCTLPTVTVNLTVNGSDGPVNLIQGDAKNISWTTTNATSCTASSSDGFGGAKSVPSGLESLTANTTSNHTLTCNGPGGIITSDSVQVNVSCTPSIGAYGACQCPQETKSRTNVSAACVSYIETVDCTSTEKNSCRDFNWREVAP